MCLAVPGQIIELNDGVQATLDMMGVRRPVSLALTPQARPGDWVLVHAGFAIEVIDAESAVQTIDLIRELDELTAEDLGSTATAEAR